MTKKKINKELGLFNFFMSIYSTTQRHIFQLIAVLTLVAFGFLLAGILNKEVYAPTIPKKSHWLVLHRKSNKEYLYLGVPGEKQNSELVKIFMVKTGIPGERPTPLPKLLGREYWKITGKVEIKDDPETAPYFLILDIPYSEDYPYGPTPYLECNGQCDWILPGSFGLHGINGDSSRLAAENSGSSGCVRHTDKDITYLYNLLNPQKEEIRYYIDDV